MPRAAQALLGCPSPGKALVSTRTPWLRGLAHELHPPRGRGLGTAGRSSAYAAGGRAGVGALRPAAPGPLPCTGRRGARRPGGLFVRLPPRGRILDPWAPLCPGKHLPSRWAGLTRPASIAVVAWSARNVSLHASVMRRRNGASTSGSTPCPWERSPWTSVSPQVSMTAQAVWTRRADRCIRTGQRMVEQRERYQDPCGSRRLPSRGLRRQTLGDMLCHRSDERGPQKRVGPLP